MPKTSDSSSIKSPTVLVLFQIKRMITNPNLKEIVTFLREIVRMNSITFLRIMNRILIQIIIFPKLNPMTYPLMNLFRKTKIYLILMLVIMIYLILMSMMIMIYSNMLNVNSLKKWQFMVEPKDSSSWTPTCNKYT
jgi:hypothetical protein